MVGMLQSTAGSASMDGILCVWDLLSGACMYSIQVSFASAVLLTGLLLSVAYPDPGSGAFFDPRIRDAEKIWIRLRIHILDHFFESLETFFWVINI
jgi:hypothetical protein